jgi:hypothetical protein
MFLTRHGALSGTFVEDNHVSAGAMVISWIEAVLWLFSATVGLLSTAKS